MSPDRNPLRPVTDEARSQCAPDAALSLHRMFAPKCVAKLLPVGW